MSPPVRWVAGRCWLYCLRTGVRVTWVGPVHHDGAHAPMYACEPCLRVLAGLVRAHGLEQDAPPYGAAAAGPVK